MSGILSLLGTDREWCSKCNGVIDAVGFMSMSLPKEDTGVEEGVGTMNRLRSNH